MNEPSTTKQELIEEVNEGKSTESNRLDRIIVAQRDLALALAEASSLQEAMDLCLDTAIRVSGFDSGGIYLLDPVTGALHLAAARGVSDEFARRHSHYPSNSDRTRLVISGTPYYWTGEDLLSFSGTDPIRGEGIRSLAVIPIMNVRQILGCLNVASHVMDRIPDDSRNALETIASQIGSTIKRIRAEEERGDRIAELTAIYDHSPLLMVILDRESRVRKVNAAAIRFAETAGSDMIGRHSGEALRCLHALEDPGGCGFGPHCRECTMRRTMMTTFETGQSQHQVEASLPFSFQGKNRTLTFLLYTSLLKISGEPLVLISLLNITERKTLERQLFEAQKMEAIGTLAGGIAHDFNNILVAINGFAEMAAEETDEGARKDHLDQVLKASERAKNLIRQILSFSRRTVQGKKPSDMGLIVKEAVKLLRQALPATIEIRQRITDPPCTVDADPTQMHQILMNLCTNAAQAMGESGGVMEVNLSRSEILPAGRHPETIDLKPGIYAKLTVSDTGVGIDPAVMARIFEPFFTTKKTTGGTGLGLSVVYGIVKNHEGQITAASEPGDGTTFTVYLPCAAAGPSIERVQPPASLPGGSERILFVDDEPAIVEVAMRILFSLGYDVTARTDSAEALAEFLQGPDRFDLVITDMTMPHLTGRDLACKIMEMKPDTPVILCTGYNEHITAEQAFRIGIKAFMTKPFTRGEFARVVRDVLDGSDEKSKR